MNECITYIGLDVHKETIAAECRVKSMLGFSLAGVILDLWINFFAAIRGLAAYAAMALIAGFVDLRCRHAGT